MIKLANTKNEKNQDNAVVKCKGTESKHAVFEN